MLKDTENEKKKKEREIEGERETHTIQCGINIERLLLLEKDT